MVAKKAKKATKKVLRARKSKTETATASPESESSVQKLAKQFMGLFSKAPTDIVGAIKDDHDGLRNFLKILKDTDEDITKRKHAYASFAALLKSHSSSEEKAVYTPTMELVGREMHLKVTEGFVEHRLADDLMARIEKTKDPMEWSAHANVLSEIVEHHLKEEESDLLPLIRRTATPVQNAKMLEQFVSLRRKTQKKVTKKNAGVLK